MTSLAPPEPRRVGLVGLGRIATRHLDALRSMPDAFSLVGACDTNPDIRAQFSEAPVFASMEALLAEVNPECVAIATPSGLHAQHIEMAARAGCHILVEKPLALSLEDAERAARACRDAGVSLLVVHPLRHWPNLTWARDVVLSGALGEIHTVDARVFWTRPEAYYKEAPWRATKSLDGGVWHNQANHYVDLLVWLMGKPDRVFADQGTFGIHAEVPNAGAVQMRWGATIGSMRSTLRTYPKNLEASLTILGERGSLVLSGMAGERVTLATWEGGGLEADAMEALNQATAAVRARGHALVYEEWLRTPGTQRVADPTCFDALRLLDAVEASAHQAIPVYLS